MKSEQALKGNPAFVGSECQASLQYGIENNGSVTKSDLTRNQILYAAARLFRRQGYAGTTLRQIAAAANMKAGSIYYHFSSKDQIVDEVLDIGTRAIFNAVQAAVAALGPDAACDDKIRAALDAHLRTLFSKGDFTSANVRIYGQLPEQIKARHRPLRRAYGHFWDELFTAAQRAGTARADLNVIELGRFVVGALSWTIEWFDPEKKDTGDLIEQISALVFEGISGR